jgi:hypothetical protein
MNKGSPLLISRIESGRESGQFTGGWRMTPFLNQSVGADARVSLIDMKLLPSNAGKRVVRMVHSSTVN